MNQPRSYFDFSLVLILVAALLLTSARAAEPGAKPDSLAALQKEVESILHREGSRTPGAAVAVVRRDGPEWVAGLGLADVATNKSVTADTLFRIASTSKTFVALAILKLQQEGKLRLDDTLRSHAPDLKFTNPWEATDPVRLVHLLEHTTGWEDLAMMEYAYNPPEEPALRASLALRPATRTSRWKPGTRYSYSNMGPAASAYVIERITGQRFEDYVAENWFRPLGMKTASYFGTPEVLQHSTQLYRPDGRTTYPYWRIAVRPSGAINASARDMGNYVQFYLNRGSVGGVQLLPSASIDRMERPATTYAARDGLSAGYGLHLVTSVHDGGVWRGHDGAFMGGLCEFKYRPELGVGYCVMINSSNGGVLGEISRTIRNYLTRSADPRALPPAVTLPADFARDYDGWYEPITPRQEIGRFLVRIGGMAKVNVGEQGFTFKELAGTKVFVATSTRTFRHKHEFAATAALISDRSEGVLIVVDGNTLRRLPPGVAQLQMALSVAPFVLGLSSLVFALVWVPRSLWGGLRGDRHLRVRALPLVATLAGIAMVAAIGGALPDAINRLGHLTGWSVSIFVFSLVFPALSWWSLGVAWRSRHAPMPRLVWWHSFATSLALSIACAYLGYWGVVGWRTWV